MNDAEIDEIVWRRFGSRHEKPCNDPGTLTCAMWECQIANRCVRYPPKLTVVRQLKGDDAR